VLFSRWRLNDAWVSFNYAQPCIRAGQPRSGLPLNFTLGIQTIIVTYSYRKAEQTERDAIFNLYYLVMRGYISEIWGWDEQWQENDFSTHFDLQGITLVCKEHELVGYSQVENRGGQLFIRMIVVHPHHQRKGIGSKLLESAIASGKKQSKSIGLEVFKINDDAKKFYERYGFNVESETTSSFVMGLMPNPAFERDCAKARSPSI
jgi:ribosomal protein S18 acetylase RimI-like enzyme